MTNDVSPSAATEAQAFLASAQAAHQGGDVASAEKFYRKCLARQPDLKPAQVGLVFALVQQERLGEAETLGKRHVAAPDAPADLWNLLGHVYHRRAHVGEAAQAFRKAIELNPKLGLAWANLGALHLDAGETAAAVATLQRAVRLLPANTEALNNLAIAQMADGDLDRSELTLQSSLAHDPKRADTYGLMAQVYRIRGAAEKAVSLMETALALGASNLTTHAFVADCYRSLGRFEHALASYRQALALDPSHQRLKFMVAECLLQLKRAPEAVTLLQEIDPGDDEALRLEHNVSLGIALSSVGEDGQAEARLVQAYVQAPESARALDGLAKFYDQRGDIGRALPLCRQTAATHPRSAQAQYNLGTALAKSDHSLEAIEVLQRAVSLQNCYPLAHQNLAMIHLRLLQLKEGWQHYAWRSYRFKTEGAKAQWVPRTPRLAQDLGGQVVEVIGEQGLGDELFFMRYLPALKARGARVVYRLLGKKLESVIRAHPLIDELSFEPARDGGERIKLLAGDLPLALGDPDWEQCPAAVPLQADAERVARLRAQWLDGLGPRPKIGIAWRAGTQQDKLTSNLDLLLSKEVPLEPLLDILAPLDVEVVVLQRNPRPDELERLGQRLGRPFLDASDMDTDLSDTLALIASLDRLVGVSNTNVHLAAGLGVGGNVLAPYPYDFRWPEVGDGSPWFPQYRLHREVYGQGWGAALASLAEDLNARYGRV